MWETGITALTFTLVLLANFIHNGYMQQGNITIKYTVCITITLLLKIKEIAMYNRIKSMKNWRWDVKLAIPNKVINLGIIVMCLLFNICSTKNKVPFCDVVGVQMVV